MTTVKPVTACAAVLCAALCAVLMGPVAGASASDASIKKVFKQWDSRLLISEGHLETALGEYKTRREAAQVESALGNAIDVLRGLKTKISQQSAVSTRVKEGKAKVVKGLGKLIVAYEHLKSAFTVKATSQQAAQEQAQKAKLALKHGAIEFLEGAKLLK
jgi:hypothetical protein